MSRTTRGARILDAWSIERGSLGNVAFPRCAKGRRIRLPLPDGGVVPWRHDDCDWSRRAARARSRSSGCSVCSRRSRRHCDGLEIGDIADALDLSIVRPPTDWSECFNGRATCVDRRRRHRYVLGRTVGLLGIALQHQVLATPAVQGVLKWRPRRTARPGLPDRLPAAARSSSHTSPTRRSTRESGNFTSGSRKRTTRPRSASSCSPRWMPTASRRVPRPRRARRAHPPQRHRVLGPARRAGPGSPGATRGRGRGVHAAPRLHRSPGAVSARRDHRRGVGVDLGRRRSARAPTSSRASSGAPLCTSPPNWIATPGRSLPRLKPTVPRGVAASSSVESSGRCTRSGISPDSPGAPLRPPRSRPRARLR